ncbi:MAG: ATP-binding protein [Candidatus Cloacimonetes bacterium]|nr:ATP-binding protein [Candidatus Cloacimonadota bacterium]
MSLIPRSIFADLEREFFGGKALIVMGPRQSGKTTLINMLRQRFSDRKCLYLNADDPFVRNQWQDPSLAEIKRIIADNELVIIDEAQRIKNIGINIKMIVDEIPQVQVLATGSSSFELSNAINEPLTGRKYEYSLYPLSYVEMCEHHGFWEERKALEGRVIYGYYPEVVTSNGKEKRILKELADNYLYRDIYSLEQINKPRLLENLVQALALQVSREVSVNELSQLLGADRATIDKYLSLLEKAYVIYKLPALSRNHRNEIKKSRKYYFWDNGILNAILGNFNELAQRADAGALWENFIISERIKACKNAFRGSRFYFWRSVQMQEIDFVEEESAAFWAAEIKLNPKRRVRIPKSFADNYAPQGFETVNLDSFYEFVMRGL